MRSRLDSELLSKWNLIACLSRLTKNNSNFSDGITPSVISIILLTNPFEKENFLLTNQSKIFLTKIGYNEINRTFITVERNLLFNFSLKQIPD